MQFIQCMDVPLPKSKKSLQEIHGASSIQTKASDTQRTSIDCATSPIIVLTPAAMVKSVFCWRRFRICKPLCIVYHVMCFSIFVSFLSWNKLLFLQLPVIQQITTPTLQRTNGSTPNPPMESENAGHHIHVGIDGLRSRGGVEYPSMKLTFSTPLKKGIPSLKLTACPWKSPSFLVNTIKMVDFPASYVSFREGIYSCGNHHF